MIQHNSNVVVFRRGFLAERPQTCGNAAIASNARFIVGGCGAYRVVELRKVSSNHYPEKDEKTTTRNSAGQRASDDHPVSKLLDKATYEFVKFGNPG